MDKLEAAHPDWPKVDEVGSDRQRPQSWLPHYLISVYYPLYHPPHHPLSPVRQFVLRTEADLEKYDEMFARSITRVPFLSALLTLGTFSYE